jgi:pSer/pThr/pTyr-binding forkhead associated (FHA) protein
MEDHVLSAEAVRLPTPGATAAPVAPLRLVHEPTGSIVEITRPDTLVGRHSAADVTLRLPDISRRHCRLVFTEDCWQVFDLQSLNGLYVNGERVSHAVLRHRDRIGIGCLTFEVDLGVGAPTVPLRPGAGASSEARILGSISDALPDRGPDRLAS